MSSQMNQLYNRIIKRFPNDHIRYVIAYGSGVFKQQNNVSASNMIDFVFVVSDSFKFHKENLQLNPTHYSFLRHLGPHYLSRFQEDIPAGCYYNTLVPVRLEDGSRQLIKYGIIGEKTLVRDLYDWDYLYISGRLQKPVSLTKSAHTTETASFDLAFQTNLQNALHTALLLLPERFSLEELFVMITSLSYMGDFRMIVGENKNKCINIVKPQVPAFTDLYKAYILKECIEDYLLCDFENGQCVQRSDQQTVYRHLNLLPKNLIQTIINLKFRTSQYHDLEEYIYKLTNRVDYKDIVAQSVASIVRYSSVIQSAKGVLSAGLVKTASYSMRKLRKMIN